MSMKEPGDRGRCGVISVLSIGDLLVIASVYKNLLIEVGVVDIGDGDIHV